MIIIIAVDKKLKVHGGRIAKQKMIKRKGAVYSEISEKGGHNSNIQ